MKIRGFTLIELLVTISIIAVLSSIILVSLNGAKTKGQVASGIQFADNNYRLLSTSAIGVWNFNDATASNWSSTKDVSASGNNITLVPSKDLFTRSNITPTGSGYSLSLTASGNYATGVASNGALSSNPIKIGSLGITASTWIYFTSPITTNFDIMDAIDSDYNGYAMYISYDNGTQKLSCYSDMSKVGTDGINVQYVTTFQVNRWYHIACSVNPQGVAVLYIDGHLVSTLPGAYNNPSNWGSGSIGYLDVGASWGDDGVGFTGLMDDAAFYNQSLN